MAEVVHEAPADKARTIVTSFEDYLERYAHDYYELVEGQVVKMSPINAQHDALTFYLRLLLTTYLDFQPIGLVKSGPFVMKLTKINVSREPDIQVILKSNSGKLTDTHMNGPADICIEVVSAESVARDRGEKFEEYEKGHVREYWIVDPIHRECNFYQLDETGHYARHAEDERGFYSTPALPHLALHVPTLWQDDLPGPLAVMEAVRKMVSPPTSSEGGT